MQEISTQDPESVFWNFGDSVGTSAGTMEEVIGLEDSSAFDPVVAEAMGLRLKAFCEPEMYGLLHDADLVPSSLVARMLRVGGIFRVESVSDTRIVQRNSCSFGERVAGRESLCMTTNLFARIAAEANGVAEVKVAESIARGDKGCRVVVSLERGSDDTWNEFHT